uniref:Retrovirus-related Pol polyprotein from transposon 297 family n=1 Tax=Cajanus cajan TaxID=3821 RepID=A0A151SCI2_CAJCA|nr:Retrovirus-related Pol polyprotein from transposon 297 family [Cajanus cajan]
MQSPQTVKEVQRLSGRLVSLSRFIPKLAEKAGPIFTLLKKPKNFLWTYQCEEAFQSFKNFLTTPPVLQRPDHNTDLLLYLAVAENVISAVIVQEHQKSQTPIYFISRVLQDTERRYQMIEKLTLALVTAARRLRPHFQSHQVVVKTDYPIKQILRKPELAGRMIAWSIELSEFGIQYKSRGPLKAKCLADFVAKLTPTTTEESQARTLHVDGSSNSKGGGAGIILEGPNQVTLEQSLKFGFKVTNNQAEYEALLAGLRLAHDLGARRVNCNSDSKLMQKTPFYSRYFHTASQQISSFDEFSIKHVPRGQNARADLLSKLASTKRPGQHRTIIQETLHSPSLDDKIVNVNDSEELGWMADIWNYLKEGTLPKDKDEARKVRMRSAKFIIIDDELFKRGISTPLLKCLTTSQAAYVVKEIHQGICGMHSGACSMAARSTTQETPYRLTYGADAMIPVKVGQTSHRRQVFNSEQNTHELATDLDLLDELRDEAQIHEEACKLQASRRYNSRVRPRSFRTGDLVWRLLGEARKDVSDGKLAPTWGGPFRVAENLENGAYRLEELSGKPVTRTWNATHLKFYFS